MDFDFIRATEGDKNYLFALRKQTMVAHLEKSAQYLSDEQHIRRLNQDFANSSRISR